MESEEMKELHRIMMEAEINARQETFEFAVFLFFILLVVAIIVALVCYIIYRDVNYKRKYVEKIFSKLCIGMDVSKVNDIIGSVGVLKEERCLREDRQTIKSIYEYNKYFFKIRCVFYNNRLYSKEKYENL